MTRQKGAGSGTLWYTNHGAASAAVTSTGATQSRQPSWRRRHAPPRTASAATQMAGRKNAATNFVMKPRKNAAQTAAACRRADGGPASTHAAKWNRPAQ